MKRSLSRRLLGVVVLGASLLGAGHAAVVGRPLHSFAGPDGVNPSTPLLLASDGNWYGTTALGGAHRKGTVFRITPDGSFSVLHSFDVKSAGRDWDQVSGLSEGPDHALYGNIAPASQYHGGILFRVTLAGEYKTLHEFGGFKTFDGRAPIGPPVPGPDGNFYGATRAGGAHGLGAIYRMTPSGEVTLIHSFGSTDGTSPSTALAVGPDGQLYGGTTYGPAPDYGMGSVSRMGLGGENFTVIHAWPKSRKEGVFPNGLVLAPGGVIYGVTIGLDSGPNGNCQGLAFKLDADGAFSVVQCFRNGGRAGIQPNGHLALGSDGALYGATYSGGLNDAGAVFRIEADGHLRLLATLGGSDNAPRWPRAGATPAPDGSVWFTTLLGGRHHDGQWGAVVRVPAH